jgi:hypothetical protein
LVPELLKISSTDGKVTTFEKNYTNDDEMVLYIDVKTLNDALQTVKICAVKAIVVE